MNEYCFSDSFYTILRDAIEIILLEFVLYGMIVYLSDEPFFVTLHKRFQP